MLPEAWKEAQSVIWHASINIELDTRTLRSALTRLIQQAIGKYRICFFIDGLDEFDDKNSRLIHEDLVKLLDEWLLIAPGQIKMCVSSREHNVFVDAFSNVPRQRLQDLTRSDITKVVRDGLRGYDIDGQNRETLTSKILESADGVFLWVSLVLNTIRQSISNEYPFKQIMSLVDETPSDVEELLQRIFDSIRIPWLTERSP